MNTVDGETVARENADVSVRVALVQMRSTRVVSENLAVIEQETRKAAADGCRIVVFPEASMVNFGPKLHTFAEALDGAFASALAALAEELNVVIVAGMFTPVPSEPEKVFNTVLVTGAGMHQGYNKIHLFDSWGTRESDQTVPGKELMLFTVDGITFSIATCFDIRFPELFYTLAEQGAHAVIVLANWGIGEGKAEAWQLLTRARAVDSTMWVLGCGQAEGSRIIPFGVGLSNVVDPLGRVQHECGTEPGRIIASVGLDEVHKAREVLPVLQARRVRV